MRSMLQSLERHRVERRRGDSEDGGEHKHQGQIFDPAPEQEQRLQRRAPEGLLPGERPRKQAGRQQAAPLPRAPVERPGSTLPASWWPCSLPTSLANVAGE